MFYTLDRAVQVTGLSRAAILRAIEHGQISVTKNLFGGFQIEHEELCRVGPALAENERLYAASTATAGNAATLEAEIAAVIRDAGDTLRGKPDDHRCDIEPVAFPATDWSETGEYSAGLPKNIDHMVKDAGLDRPRWDPEIRISDAERLSPSGVKGTRRALVARAMLGALGIACILAYMVDRLVLTRATRVEAAAPSLELKTPAAGEPKTIRDGAAALPRTDEIAALVVRTVARRSDSPPRAAKASPAASAPPAKPSSRPMPFPETEPTTIDGWKVLDVVGGKATLRGPTGVWTVARGDRVPGVGSVESIVRWGNRWIVATSGGLISTPSAGGQR
jgi:hypothetical protein